MNLKKNSLFWNTIFNNFRRFDIQFFNKFCFFEIQFSAKFYFEMEINLLLQSLNFH